MEEINVHKMQNFLNQQYNNGEDEIDAYRNLMDMLGLTPIRKIKKLLIKTLPAGMGIREHF